MISLDALKKSLAAQVKALEKIALSEGATVGYVKPHGALYSIAMDDERHAKCLAQLAAAGRRNVALVGMPHSALEHLCRKSGVMFVREAFPDRAYDEKGKLVPRGNYGAVFSDPSEVARRAVEIVEQHRIISQAGRVFRLPGIRTLCIHSDSPNSVESAGLCRSRLEKAGFKVEPHSTLLNTRRFLSLTGWGTGSKALQSRLGLTPTSFQTPFRWARCRLRRAACPS